MVHARLRSVFVFICFSPENTLTTRQEEDDTIYDEVTEDQYKSIVKGRLQRDDFVVDDGAGAGGYMDNGMDEWTDGHEDESEEEEIRKGIYSYRIRNSYLRPLKFSQRKR